jgi:hypothetical protein
MVDAVYVACQTIIPLIFFIHPFTILYLKVTKHHEWIILDDESKNVFQLQMIILFILGAIISFTIAWVFNKL